MGARRVKTEGKPKMLMVIGSIPALPPPQTPAGPHREMKGGVAVVDSPHTEGVHPVASVVAEEEATEVPIIQLPLKTLPRLNQTRVSMRQRGTFWVLLPTFECYYDSLFNWLLFQLCGLLWIVLKGKIKPLFTSPPSTT